MEELLNDESNFAKCIYNVKQAHKKNVYPFILLFFFILKEFFTIFTISYYVDSVKLILLSLIFLIILFILICILTFYTPCKEKNNYDSFLLNKVLDNQSLRRMCAYCKDYKIDTTVHCYYCGICVEEYDHHCIWLSNCIGKNNLFTFRVFLICILFKILLNVFISFKSKFIIIKNLII